MYAPAPLQLHRCGIVVFDTVRKDVQAKLASLSYKKRHLPQFGDLEYYPIELVTGGYSDSGWQAAAARVYVMRQAVGQKEYLHSKLLECGSP